jgi:hypothetical protein
MSMARETNESWDFRRNFKAYVFLWAVIVLGWGAASVYTIVTGNGPWWFLVLGLAALALMAIALSSRLALAASFDDRTLRVSTLRSERAIDAAEIESVGWHSRLFGWDLFGWEALTTVQTRQGSVVIPSSKGADLLRRLKRATRNRSDNSPQ